MQKDEAKQIAIEFLERENAGRELHGEMVAGNPSMDLVDKCWRVPFTFLHRTDTIDLHLTILVDIETGAARMDGEGWF